MLWVDFREIWGIWIREELIVFCKVTVRVRLAQLLLTGSNAVAEVCAV